MGLAFAEEQYLLSVLEKVNIFPFILTFSQMFLTHSEKCTVEGEGIERAGQLMQKILGGEKEGNADQLLECLSKIKFNDTEELRNGD